MFIALLLSDIRFYIFGPSIGVNRPGHNYSSIPGSIPHYYKKICSQPVIHFRIDGYPNWENKARDDGYKVWMWILTNLHDRLRIGELADSRLSHGLAGPGDLGDGEHGQHVAGLLPGVHPC